MNELSKIQSRFKTALIAPRCPNGSGLGIRQTPEFSLKERISVYHADYFLRISESLAEDFPVLQELMGEEEFESLIRQYLAHYPSRYPGLAQVGQELPRFLYESRKFMHQPWILELVQLEWIRCLAIWTETAPVSSFLSFASLSEDQQALQKLDLQPSLHFFEGSFRVHLKSLSEISERGETKLAVWAMHGKLYEREISSEEQHLLKQIQSGISFAELMNWLNDEPAIAPEAAQWLQDWSSEGLLCGFQPART